MNSIALIVLDSVRLDYFNECAARLHSIPHTRYGNAFTTSSWTLPSIASVLTGLMPREHGANYRTAYTGDSINRLAALPNFLVPRMREKGFFSMLLSDNSFSDDFFGFNGFDYRMNPLNDPPGSFSLRDRLELLLHKRGKAPFLFDKFYENVKSPFFAFFHLMETHYPYYSPNAQRLFRRGCRAVEEASRHQGGVVEEKTREILIECYSESIKYLDGFLAKQVRRLLDRNAIVFVVGDHGEEFCERKWFGHGWNLCDEALRVPLVAFSPNQAEDKRVDEPFSLRWLWHLMQGMVPPGGEVSAELFNRFASRNPEADVRAWGRSSVEAIKALPGFQKRKLGVHVVRDKCKERVMQGMKRLGYM